MDYRTQNVLERLGIFSRTNLEKLADSFSNVKYKINYNKDNKNLGFINFDYTGQWIFKKDKQEIKKIAEKFYNKEDYMVIVSSSDRGFSIIVMNNFIKDIFNKLQN